MLFLSGYKADLTLNELQDKMKTELIGNEDYAQIEKITAGRKGTVVLHFLDQTFITAFKKKYADKEFQGGNIRLA